MRLLQSTLAALRLLVVATRGQAWRQLMAIAALASMPAFGAVPADAESVICGGSGFLDSGIS